MLSSLRFSESYRRRGNAGVCEGPRHGRRRRRERKKEGEEKPSPGSSAGAHARLRSLAASSPSGRGPIKGGRIKASVLSLSLSPPYPCLSLMQKPLPATSCGRTSRAPGGAARPILLFLGGGGEKLLSLSLLFKKNSEMMEEGWIEKKTHASSASLGHVSLPVFVFRCE